MTIEPNFAVAIDAVKLDEDQLSFCSCGNDECLAIPADTAGQRSATGTGRILLVKSAFDTPVVWQVQSPPLRVVETRVLRTGDVAKPKAPVLVERDCFSGTRIGEAEWRCKQEQAKTEIKDVSFQVHIVCF